MTDSLFAFVPTDDPAIVSIVKTDTGETVGNVILYDDSSEFVPASWRWKLSITTGNSGGGYLWKG